MTKHLMTMIKTFIDKHKAACFYAAVIVPGAFITWLFFSYSVFFSHDSAHYLTFLPILDGTVPMQAWDIVRGPTFPVYLWVITRLFGESMNVLLTAHYIVFALTLWLYYLIIASILPLTGRKSKLGVIYFIYVFAALNPLVFTYYHLVLTEHLASFFAALIVFASVKYYRYLTDGITGVKYRICQTVLIISCPILYFLRQNYIMLAAGAVLVIILLTVLHRRGRNKVLRTAAPFGCMLAVFVASLVAWNAVLPEPEDEYMEERMARRFMVDLLLPRTAYMTYTDDPDGMIVSYFNGQGEKVSTFVFDGASRKRDLSVTQATGIFLRNLTRHPILSLRGTVDSYLASINFYSSYNGTDFVITKSPSMIRATENLFLGYASFSPARQSNIHDMAGDLYELARPFENYRTAGLFFNQTFRVLSIPVNFTFTLGFLLLPFCFAASAVFAVRHKGESAFVLSLVASGMSLAYILPNAAIQFFIDRYLFPIYIATWLAILALGYGLGKLRVER